MIGNRIFQRSIKGEVSTNGNRSLIKNWRETMENEFSVAPQLFSNKVSVEIEFWLDEKRMIHGRNDLDNLVKPVFDSMKRINLIEDDANIFHLVLSKYPTTGSESVEISVCEWR